jgi:hypothetical protein
VDIEEIRDLEDMFATDGWRRVIKDATEALREREINALYGSKSYEDIMYLRGEVAQLSALVSLPEQVRFHKNATDTVEEI